jgi:uncharacterized repeat protein (TIGR01451 family)
VVLTALWEEEKEGIEVRVIKPDGTIIEEKDFPSNRIAVLKDFSSRTARSVIIDSPEEGTWDLEVTDTTGLGTVYYEATGAVELPKFSFSGKPEVNANGSVVYNFEVNSAAPSTYLTFYYDDDLSERNGLLAGSVVLRSTDSFGTFTWDASQVVPGSYFLYALVDNVSGPTLIVDQPYGVTVGSEADLAVTLGAALEEVNAGDTVELTISVSNRSTVTQAKRAITYLNLPAGVSLVSATSALKSSNFAQYEISLGDIAAAATQTVKVAVAVNTDAKAGDQFAADVYVVADTYDSETTNDGDAVQFIVAATPTPSTVSLSVDSAIDRVIAPTINQPFSYTVTVSNTGTSDATGVVLIETVQGTSLLSSNLPSTFSGNELSIAVGDLGAGKSIDVTITAIAQVAGPCFSTSWVTADGVDNAIIDNEQVNISEILGAVPTVVDLSLTVAKVANDAMVIQVNNSGPGIASDVMIQLKLPAGAVVKTSTSDQGFYDKSTGKWTVGNIRDSLTRTLTLTMNGLMGGKITAEVIGVNEVDFDSVPNDGEGDDFAAISGLYSLFPVTLLEQTAMIFFIPVQPMTPLRRWLGMTL